jgi:hypothetical protein
MGIARRPRSQLLVGPQDHVGCLEEVVDDAVDER